MHNLSLQNIATEEKTENSQEASNKSEVTIQSDASFSGTQQKHSDESSNEMGSDNETEKNCFKGHMEYIINETSWSDSIQYRWNEMLWDNREKIG